MSWVSDTSVITHPAKRTCPRWESAAVTSAKAKGGTDHLRYGYVDINRYIFISCTVGGHHPSRSRQLQLNTDAYLLVVAMSKRAAALPPSITIECKAR